jgi:hypothetical protein
MKFLCVRVFCVRMCVCAYVCSQHSVLTYFHTCLLMNEQAPLVCEFDWEMDELDEFVTEKMEEEELEGVRKVPSFLLAVYY